LEKNLDDFLDKTGKIDRLNNNESGIQRTNFVIFSLFYYF